MNFRTTESQTTQPQQGCVAAIDWGKITHAIISGDQQAFAIYYDEHFDLMFRQASRLSGRDEQTCLDLVQDAMLKAMRCMKPIDQAGPLRSWSRTVATTVTYDWLRKQSKQIQFCDQHVQSTESEDDISLVQSARLQWIENQLEAVPAELRNLISLRYRLGWSLKKIAQSVGLKTGAVDGRIRRTVESLRQQAKIEIDD